MIMGTTFLVVEYSRWLSQSHKELDNVKQVNERLSSENRGLKLDIYNSKIVDKQLTKKDGQIGEETLPQ